jgi:hypothetical protein
MASISGRVASRCVLTRSADFGVYVEDGSSTLLTSMAVNICCRKRWAELSMGLAASSTLSSCWCGSDDQAEEI